LAGLGQWDRDKWVDAEAVVWTVGDDEADGGGFGVGVVYCVRVSTEASGGDRGEVSGGRVYGVWGGFSQESVGVWGIEGVWGSGNGFSVMVQVPSG